MWSSHKGRRSSLNIKIIWPKKINVKGERRKKKKLPVNHCKLRSTKTTGNPGRLLHMTRRDNAAETSLKRMTLPYFHVSQFQEHVNPDLAGDKRSFM
jgi:hypothetical protein